MTIIKPKEVTNDNMIRAREDKRDEFYTLYKDIEDELIHYHDQLEGKSILMNADNADESQFWRYFYNHFNQLKLKKITATYHSSTERVVKTTYDGHEIIKEEMNQNGDFRSPEVIELMKQADVVITNPPFSLFREYIEQLLVHEKKFLIIGNHNAVTYVDLFPYIRDEVVKLGHQVNAKMKFYHPDDYERYDDIDENGNKYSFISSISWFTTLAVNKKYVELELTKKYCPTKYPKYDNYDAIEVSQVGDIPKDYFGMMGVPINYLANHNPEQFKILGSNRGINQKGDFGESTYIDGKETFKRLFIQRKER